MNKNLRLSTVALACAFALAACSTTQQTKPNEGAGANQGQVATQNGAPGAYTPADLQTDPCLRQRVVYFDFDQTTIRPEFQRIIACHAKYLQDRPTARIRLEGNADERGSREYNLGLGERRARAVGMAMVADGASKSQIGLVSYGEEVPVCRAHTQSCWAKNRRVEIVYTAE